MTEAEEKPIRPMATDEGHLYGKYQGKNIVRVPADPLLTDDVIKALNAPGSATANRDPMPPYMPLVGTELSQSYNPLLGNKNLALGQWMGLAMLINKFVESLNRDDTKLAGTFEEKEIKLTEDTFILDEDCYLSKITLNKPFFLKANKKYSVRIVESETYCCGCISAYGALNPVECDRCSGCQNHCALNNYCPSRMPPRESSK
jgi:hypothetical protein